MHRLLLPNENEIIVEGVKAQAGVLCRDWMI